MMTMPTAFGLPDHRPIDEDDIASAVRGLRLDTKRPQELTEFLQHHAKVPMFASAVIVVAAARRLALTDVGIAWETLTDDELAAIGRDPAQLTRTAVKAEQARRAGSSCPSCGRDDMIAGACEATDDCPSYFEERGIKHPDHG